MCMLTICVYLMGHCDRFDHGITPMIIRWLVRVPAELVMAGALHKPDIYHPTASSYQRSKLLVMAVMTLQPVLCASRQYLIKVRLYALLEVEMGYFDKQLPLTQLQLWIILTFATNLKLQICVYKHGVKVPLCKIGSWFIMFHCMSIILYTIEIPKSLSILTNFIFTKLNYAKRLATQTQ